MEIGNLVNEFCLACKRAVEAVMKAIRNLFQQIADALVDRLEGIDEIRFCLWGSWGSAEPIEIDDLKESIGDSARYSRFNAEGMIVPSPN